MITGYGAMIALGLLSAGALACWLGHRFSLDVNDVILLSTYTVAFGISGAKILYLALNFSLIDWPHFFEWEYFRALMGGGFVFYGGVPAGIAGLYLAGWLHHIRVADYLRACLPSLPLVHGFGRIGCALAGCCYGIPYSGPFALTYHNSIAAPHGVSLFPVQLLEAGAEFAICALLLYLVLKYQAKYNLLSLYLLLYGSARFFLEFLRYDAARGGFYLFSTSQWISIFILILLAGYWLCSRTRAKNIQTDCDEDHT